MRRAARAAWASMSGVGQQRGQPRRASASGGEVGCAITQAPPASASARALAVWWSSIAPGSGTRIDGRPADREFRDRRGAGARDDQMRARQPLGHVGEERRQLGGDAAVRIGRAHAVQVLRPALLRHRQPRPQSGAAAPRAPAGTTSLNTRAPSEPPSTSSRIASVGGGVG